MLERVEIIIPGAEKCLLCGRGNLNHVEVIRVNRGKGAHTPLEGKYTRSTPRVYLTLTKVRIEGDPYL